MVGSDHPSRAERLSAALLAADRLNVALGQPQRWRRRRVRAEVEDAAREFLERLAGFDDRDLVTVDRRVRSWSEYTHWGAGRNLVHGFVAPDTITVQGASAAASFAVNGFVREQACRALGGFLPWAVPLLVIRATDWVPEVRTVALEGLRRVGAADLARRVGLVEHLSSVRARSEGLDDLVSVVLNTPAGLAELSTLRKVDDRLLRRTAWRLLMQWSPQETAAQLAEAASDPDPWLRHWAVTHSAAGGPAVEKEVARALRGDPVGLLRAIGLSAEIKLGSADENSVLAALSDSSGAVRSVAQHHLRANGVEPASLYRERLTEGATVGDILGLGEVGEPSDATLLRQWLADSRPRYRQASMISRARLGGRDADEAAAALDDPSPRVAHTAARLLGTPRLPSGLVAQIEARAASGPPSARRTAVVLLRPYPWRWLLAILRCLTAAEDDIKDFAREELTEWQRRSATLTSAPPTDIADAIRELLPSVSTKNAQLIEFALRTAAPR